MRLIAISAAAAIVAACTTPVRTCQPVGKEYFMLPPTAFQEVSEADSEKEFVDKSIGGLKEDIQVRDCRLLTICAHQENCRPAPVCGTLKDLIKSCEKKSKKAVAR